MHKRTYCYVCGDKVQPVSEFSWHCDTCRRDYYQNPSPCVEAAIFDTDGRLLLAQRGVEPWIGKFDLPGGFMEPGELLLTALWRELGEEMDLRAEDVTPPEFVTEWIGEYPYGGEVYPTLVFTFWARLKAIKKFEAHDDVVRIAPVSPSDIKREQISIPEAYDAIMQSVQKFHNFAT